MKRTLFILLLFSPLLSTSQTLDEDFDFLLYLSGNQMRDEAVELVKGLRIENDSTNFMKGLAYYGAHRLDTASHYYSLVGKASPLHTEAVFFNALSQAHLKRYTAALTTLSEIESTDTAVANLQAFEAAGMHLLRRDLRGFDSCFSLLHTGDYRIESEAMKLLELRNTIADRKDKKPWMAAGLSTLVPGLGKIYAGNLGEGLSAFILTGSLIGVTAENWYREGLKNWKTILFGTIATVFYIGNIYGSAVTVSVSKEAFNNETDLTILYNIHIPLRNSFRR